ncbi:MAG: YnbE family lipoprotein [Novosphingobium sp.]
MNADELTNRARIAIVCPMQGSRTGKRWSLQPGKLALAMVMGGAVALSGCVSVKAPDKPIVIELNINIKQEVVYRLAADAGKTIDENSGIF